MSQSASLSSLVPDPLQAEGLFPSTLPGRPAGFLSNALHRDPVPSAGSANHSGDPKIATGSSSSTGATGSVLFVTSVEQFHLNLNRGTTASSNPAEDKSTEASNPHFLQLQPASSSSGPSLSASASSSGMRLFSLNLCSLTFCTWLACR